MIKKRNNGFNDPLITQMDHFKKNLKNKMNFEIKKCDSLHNVNKVLRKWNGKYLLNTELLNKNELIRVGENDNWELGYTTRYIEPKNGDGEKIRQNFNSIKQCLIESITIERV